MDKDNNNDQLIAKMAAECMNEQDMLILRKKLARIMIKVKQLRNGNSQTYLNFKIAISQAYDT